MLLKKITGAFLILLISLQQLVHAQEKSAFLDKLPLQNLQSLKPSAKSWKIMGDVYVNPEKLGQMKTSAGEGVLVSMPAKNQEGKLETEWQHNDLDLELEFMLSKGASAKILLQGLYEVALKDSWGIKIPTNVDCGGLGKISFDDKTLFNGIAPFTNACKAPGTWQKMFISFSAPVYDQQGKKIKEARLNKLVLNNTIIHENIDLTLRSSANNTASKQLTFISESGPVAFKNISYGHKAFAPVTIKDIRYEYFEERVHEMPDFKKLTAKKSGEMDAITWQPALENDGFVFRYKGKLNIPETVPYTFTLVSLGGSEIKIDGKSILFHKGTHDHDGYMSRDDKSQNTLTLNKGEHEFEMVYFKNTWAPVPILGVFVEGKGNYKQVLHAPSSYPDEEAVNRILLEPANEAYILRGFMRFMGKRKTHCVAVGDPSGLHYAFDLSDGSLMKSWRGQFIDATPMWHGRGTQVLELPSGGLSFSDSPEWAQLDDPTSSLWPETFGDNRDYFILNGYDLNKKGQPTFRYRIGSMEVQDYLEPKENGTSIKRNLQVNNVPENTYYRIAAASKIEKMPNGSYAVNNKEFFIQLHKKGLKPIIRSIGDQNEMLLAVSPQDKEISYSIIW